MEGEGNMMVIKHNAHPLLLDEVFTLFVGCALSMLNMNSIYICVRITEPDVIGETGVEVECSNEILDECEEEDEAFMLEEDEMEEGSGGMVVTGNGTKEGGLGIQCSGQFMVTRQGK